MKPFYIFYFLLKINYIHSNW